MSARILALLLAFAAIACSANGGPGLGPASEDASAGDGGKEASVKPAGSVDGGLNAPCTSTLQCHAPLICLAGACFD